MVVLLAVVAVCLSFLATRGSCKVYKGLVSNDSNTICHIHEYCNNTDEIITTLLNDESNYQELLKSLYPINVAKSQFTLFIFFTNNTPIQKEVCSKPPYEGLILELDGYKNVHGTMWYSSTTNQVVATELLYELGLIYPQYSSGVLLKRNPYLVEYSAVCLTLPFLISDNSGTFRTSEALMKVTFVLPETILKRRVDSQAYSRAAGTICGILSEKGKFCYPGCIPLPDLNRHGFLSPHRFFALSIYIWIPLIAIVLYSFRNKLMLQFCIIATESHSFALSWSIVLVSGIFWIYNFLLLNTLMVSFFKTERNCIDYSERVGIGGLAIILFFIATLSLIAVKTEIPFHIPVPLLSIFRILTFRLVNQRILKRVSLFIAVWNMISASLLILGHLPYTLVALATDPYRNIFLLAAIINVFLFLVCITSAFFSLNQIFISDATVSFLWREGVKRCLFWILLSVAALCILSFSVCLHGFVLLDMRLPLRGSINFSWIFSVVVTGLLPRILPIAMKYIPSSPSHLL